MKKRTRDRVGENEEEDKEDEKKRILGGINRVLNVSLDVEYYNQFKSNPPQLVSLEQRF